MSLHRVETELGPKTRVHASSCNQDLSCLGGDCPSFVTVETEPGTGYRKPAAPVLSGRRRPGAGRRASGSSGPTTSTSRGSGGPASSRMNALLSWAALIDGLHVLSYDQTGAAQKWGPVLSSLILARPEHDGGREQGRARPGRPLPGARPPGGRDPRQPRALRPGAHGGGRERVGPAERRDGARTWTSRRPSTRSAARSTASRGPAPTSPSTRGGCPRACSATTWRPTCWCWAWPTRPGSCRSRRRRSRRPSRLNGVAVDAEPPGLPLRPALGGRSGPGPGARRAAGAVVRDRAGGGARAARRPGRERLRVAPRPLRASRPGGAPDARAPRRRADRLPGRPLRGGLRGRSSSRWRRARRRSRPGAADVTHAVIRNLYKLMAYKDEYEVARLHLKPAFHAGTRGLFAAPRRLSWHLHPPLLRALGLKRKLRLGPVVPARAPGPPGAPAAPGDAVRPLRLRGASAGRSGASCPGIAAS